MATELDVDVVRANLAHIHDLDRFAQVLSADERHRSEGYKIALSRDVFTLARGLLRLELARRMEVEPRSLHFEVRSSGKPDLRSGPPSRPDWRFSVAHSGPHVAIAFARHTDLGLDLERLGRRVEPLQIAKRYFTPRELEALEATAAGERPRAFFAGWTRKEAIVKARGHTMAESLATLTVDLDPAARHPGYEDADTVGPRPPCRLTTFEVAEEKLIGAVALLSDLTPRLRFRVVSGPAFD